jgi:glucokinase
MPMPPAASFIGLEIASGSLRGARVNIAGRSLAQYAEPMSKMSIDGIVSQLVSAVKAVDGAGPEAAKAVGIAVPGIVARNRVSLCANLSVLDELPLADELHRRLGRPALIENDANAAALAEAWQGAGRGGRSVLYVSLGVGIGAGIVVDGRVWSGPNGYAGEIGHVHVVEAEGMPCGCGSKGCLETVAGAEGWVRRARAGLDKGRRSKLKREDLSQKAILAAADEGDPLAGDVVNETATALGSTLAAAIGLLNLDRVVIGGAAACTVLFDRVVTETKKRTLPRAFAECTFRLSGLSDGAGVLGAARLARIATMFGEPQRPSPPGQM